eukprot:CAMPEP_0174338878 /NCGR_PEP_ID=MMETSP0810-20121108/23500_1 /TAXON_ID=73025 ORGANISM="Eutreptiella gymnastica-like, Strain CCMP1594" /NCGR_SAMPLE_ID=MMETSP0810 /ASSEMBLY_ACC=CAM_ASM_000659 /LENGTH=69 /DNA_ID=CAMNT_0015459251 /DNA_START=173 /DNA_END=378 /DNA_ORIENTATION=+
MNRRRLAAQYRRLAANHRTGGLWVCTANWFTRPAQRALLSRKLERTAVDQGLWHDVRCSNHQHDPDLVP